MAQHAVSVYKKATTPFGCGWHGPEAHRTQVKAVFPPQQQLCAGDHGLTARSDVRELAQLLLDRPHVECARCSADRRCLTLTLSLSSAAVLALLRLDAGISAPSRPSPLRRCLTQAPPAASAARPVKSIDREYRVVPQVRWRPRRPLMHPLVDVAPADLCVLATLPVICPTVSAGCMQHAPSKRLRVRERTTSAGLREPPQRRANSLRPPVSHPCTLSANLEILSVAKWLSASSGPFYQLVSGSNLGCSRTPPFPYYSTYRCERSQSIACGTQSKLKAPWAFRRDAYARYGARRLMEAVLQ